MILNELRIHHLRNIASIQFLLNPRFNFISGSNASGKTSILEALYLLSCGHSFRSREILPLISHGQHTLTVFARSYQNDTISIQKSNSDPTYIKLNNQFCSSTSQLAYALPCLIFYSDIFQIIDAGPSVRRNLLDWGLFHVKHNYLCLLKDYKKALRQRNALLRQRAPYALFLPWDRQLCHLSEQLHQLRENYFNQWKNEFFQVLSKLSDVECSIKYYKGWDRKDTGKTLDIILQENFNSDNQRLYTQYGAHQADLIIETNQNNKAKLTFSRGQQKIILITLKLAQGNLVKSDCLHLIDDLPAELDEIHQDKLMAYLSKRAGQYVITTSTNPSRLIADGVYGQHSVYHLCQGSINT